jgi:hypothetical protein
VASAIMQTELPSENAYTNAAESKRTYQTTMIIDSDRRRRHHHHHQKLSTLY